MKIHNLILPALTLACILIVVISCSKDLGYNTKKVSLDVSGDYAYDFTTSEMGKLGRVLFYDQSLSANNAISCGSCHKQSLAFSDGKRFSKGFENIETERNTPAIQNLGQGNFPVISLRPLDSNSQALFWDGRVRGLRDMVVQPFLNHVEMGIKDRGTLVQRVKARSYYKDLFVKAYGSEEITFERINEALTGFVSSISSNNGVFFTLGSFPTDDPVRRGMELFQVKYNCRACHDLSSPSGYFEPIKGEELVNIGLDKKYEDQGSGAITGKEEDNGKFKIPNLRNVELTAPYMHDGRFETLEEVIGHYSSGIQDHENLDDRLKDAVTGQPLVLNITQQEKQDIIAFLKSLTDRDMLTDPKYSDPFIEQ